MNIRKEESKMNSMVTDHWKNKFDRAIRILLKSGYKIDELIEKIRVIALEENEKNN